MILPMTVQKIEFQAGRRIVAVSDIHGNLPFFTGLLEKVQFTTADILVLVGDILEKGADSLALLRHVMALSKTHTVHCVCGNCDGLIQIFFNGADWDDGFFKRYVMEHPESTLRQMAAEISCDHWDDLPRLRDTLRAHFADEWAFLRSMPIVLETPHLFFVHGGVPSLEGVEELDSWRCMKNDYFLDQKRSFSKYLVVGHCPVTLYDDTIQCAAPIIDRTHHVLSIDGGCVLKLDGQLNALVIPQDGDEDFSWVAYDGQRTVIARDNQAEGTQETTTINVRWGHNQVDVLQDGEEFSHCRHLESGRTIDILTRYLTKGADGTFTQDCTDYQLPVSSGEALSVCEEVTGGILAKKKGVTGWYWGRFDDTTDQSYRK